MFPLSYREIDSLSLKLGEIKNFDENPIYRRATPNMALANIACMQILERNPSIKKEDLSFVLGTAFGEVESSLKFLKTYAEEGIARPNLFQNSLHNSTLGFVTIQLGLTGPAMTVSQGKETKVATEKVAETLLNITEHVLICMIDVTPDELNRYYKDAFPEIEPWLGQARCRLWKRTSESERV